MIVVLSPPSCDTGFGLRGGSPPTQSILVPVSTGICVPATVGPAYSATGIDSSSDAIALTWNGAATYSSGALYAYAKGVSEVTLTFPQAQQ